MSESYRQHSQISDEAFLDLFPSLSGESTGRSRSTRQALLVAAVQLFKERSYESVSVAEIARLADAFPNQVTYHFGGKEALFVEAACRSLLHTAKQAERRTRQSANPQEHARTLLAFLLGPEATSVMMFAEAMLTARRKQDLQEHIEGTVHELYVAGEAALIDTFMRTGWKALATPAAITRAFWSSVFGLALEKAALGENFDYSSAEAVAIMMIGMSPGTVGPPSVGLAGQESEATE